MYEISAFSAGNQYRDKPIPSTRVGGFDREISEDALNAIDKTLAAARAAGLVIYVRVGYTDDEVFGSEPRDFAMLLRHQEQVGAILSKYPDVVKAIECGMVGPWAEMHSTSYGSKEHIAAIIDKWIKSTPATTAILLRAPNHLLHYANVETTEEFFASREKVPGEERLGMYNDGFLGTDWDYGTWPGGKKSFTRAQGEQYLGTRWSGPYGGECAYVSLEWAKKVNILMPEKYNIVREFYAMHLSFLRNIRQKISLIEYLDSIPFSTQTYAFTNMPSLVEYDGQTLRRFIDDHLGYRFVVRKVGSLLPAKKGKDMLLGFDVENTGFANATGPIQMQVVFTQGEKTCVSLGKVTLSVEKWASGKISRVGVRTRVPKELEKGSCTVSVRLSMPLADEQPLDTPRRAIRFANEQMWDEKTQSNILGTLTIN